MNEPSFFAALRSGSPREPGLVGSRLALALGAMLDDIDALAADLVRSGVRILASALPNGPAWVIVDLAAMRAGVVHVPLPSFFTDGQREFALRAAGADAVVEPVPRGRAAEQKVLVAGTPLTLSRRIAPVPDLPPGTRKITFTSGTTATPKGVCLGEAALTVAAGLVQALAPLQIRRHLCALPLPVLLENIAGVYAPLLCGAAVVVPDPDEAGLRGSSSFQPAALDAAVRRHRAESVIVLPQMLRAWSAWRRAVSAAPQPTLKFVAVGGARVGTEVLAGARLCGLPAYEGYGLSEAGSVQTINLPWADRPGTSGRPLPHARLRIDQERQIWVAGSLMLGYLGADRTVSPAWWPTGDLGRIDADGFLQVDGRRDNVLITSFGRNVSPEWVESELQGAPAVAQAVVYGDGAPQLTAVLWPASADAGEAELAQAVESANARLPDYARVAHWIRARAPFTADSGLATANGRPRRDAIEQAHRDAIHAALRTRPPQPTDTPDVSRTAAGIDR